MKTYFKTQIIVDLPLVPHNTYFEAVIHKRKITGQVYRVRDNEVRFLTDSNETTSFSRVLGLSVYERGLALPNTPFVLTDQFSSLSFPVPPKGWIPKIPRDTFAGYIPTIKKGHVTFGCQTVENEAIIALGKALKN